ncbi:MAG: NADH-quinone oxidoreductase subunit NuoG [Armatimonadota bacterium]
MPIIHVDGVAHNVPEGTDLLSALIAVGVDVPYFCWHPALGSVGACRQCAVRLYRDESDQRGEIEMACMTPVRDGMRVSVNDREAVEFRRHVIEWLMVNHPHDCPICDEGGECHLQDMTAMVGHVYRRYRGRKRTYRNQDLGPFLNHEMNRCIQCFRCLRFYRDYAGGRDFDVMASKNHTYFGRFEDGKLESEFSGNLIEVCPTGVFTDKTLKAHYTRKWDLETAPSICVHCGLGCNIIPGARYQLLRRILNRFHPEINRYFICDRGRFGYEFVNHPARLRQPSAPSRSSAPLSWDSAMTEFAERFGACRRVVGIGSPRASLESNFALRTLVSDEAFFSGMAGQEHDGVMRAAQLLREGPARSARLAELEEADAVLLLGCDPTNEAPMADYAVRQGMFRASLDVSRKLGIPDWNDYPVREAVQNARGALFVATAAPTKLESLATEVVRCTPPEAIALGREVAAALGGGATDRGTTAGRVAAAMAAARNPVVVASAGQGPEIVDAATAVANALCAGREKPCLIFLLVPECNSMGAALMGGRALEEALAEIESGAADGLVVLENDLYRRAPAARLDAALSRLGFLAVLDHIRTRTTERADLVIPVATFAESAGTLVNNEGRAQRFFQVFVGAGQERAAWQVLSDIGAQVGGRRPLGSTEQVLAEMAGAIPALAGAVEASPPSSWRNCFGGKAARQSHRYSGRTSESADRSVFEPQPPQDADSPFAFSMEGAQHDVPAGLTPRYWRPGWNSVQALFGSEDAGGSSAQGLGARLLEPSGREPGSALLSDSSTGARERSSWQGAPGALLRRSRSIPRLLDSSDGEMWVVPAAAVFGSEELSRLAPAIASAMPEAAVLLHPDEANQRSLSDGVLARVEVGGSSYRLTVKLDGGVSRGVAIIPLGYHETAGLASPRVGRVERAP